MKQIPFSSSGSSLQHWVVGIVTLLLSFGFSVPALSQDADIKILAVNDIHSAIENFPRFAYVVDSIRAKHPDLLLFSAGDNRTGNPLNDMCEVPNRPIIDMMNAVGFNLTTMGNHECDGGMDAYLYTLSHSNFPTVVANAQPDDTLRLPNTYPYIIFERQGVRVGVLGLVEVTDQMIPSCHPSVVKELRFEKPFEAAERYSSLRDSCDVLVGLTHLGYRTDTTFANRFPYYDLLVCGHSHDLVPGIFHNGVMLVQAQKSLHYLNEVDIEVRGGKVTNRRCKTINIHAATGKSKAVNALFKKYSHNPFLKRKLCIATTPFGTKEELGCMMADALREEAGADASIVNAGAIRIQRKRAGAIRVGDVFTIFPFANDLYTYILTPQQLEEVIAQLSVADKYGPPYVSGISYSIEVDTTATRKCTVHLTSGNLLRKESPSTLSAVQSNESKEEIPHPHPYKVALDSYVASIVPCLAPLKAVSVGITSPYAANSYLSKHPTVSYKGEKRVTFGRLLQALIRKEQ